MGISWLVCCQDSMLPNVVSLPEGHCRGSSVKPVCFLWWNQQHEKLSERARHTLHAAYP